MQDAFITDRLYIPFHFSLGISTFNVSLHQLQDAYTAATLSLPHLYSLDVSTFNYKSSSAAGRIYGS